MTVKKKTIEKNLVLSDSLKSRLGATANLSHFGCNVVFVLRNVSRSDVQKTYGCTVNVYGFSFLSGPTRIVVPGKRTGFRITNYIDCLY